MHFSFISTVSVLCIAACLAPQPVGAQAVKPGVSEVVELTDEETRVLEQGEYGGGVIAGSGLLGTIVGFGSGHAVQGRFKERGWIFAAGEGGAIGAGTIIALSTGLSEAGAYAFVGGLAVAGAFRLWEIGDVWSHPFVHNRRYRKLRKKTDDPRVSFHLTPNAGGATAGLAVRF